MCRRPTRKASNPRHVGNLTQNCKAARVPTTLVPRTWTNDLVQKTCHQVIGNKSSSTWYQVLVHKSWVQSFYYQVLWYRVLGTKYRRLATK